MVRLSSITTKTGDDGTSGLVDGSRRPKHDVRFQAIGAVDEVNASLGLARLHLAPTEEAWLAKVQNDLFDMGADLATPETVTRALRLQAVQVQWLEDAQAQIQEGLQPLNSFVLPAGSPAAAALHMARTLTRRAEREVTALHEKEPLNVVVLHYINRLSDFLFVLARHCNAGGAGDVLWQPAAGQKGE